ncbi:hypothetical protein D5S18_10940 [Nocardia panacis]|uniref:Type II toxin-antitoxin system RelE/ParE family toxin n=1 Tax=Nocardia panacis TaxID=2340916 RepID=A0A3A4JZC1_9NOCA|nr:hypothetical protein [Nocardia panacis]RJO76765.1 hypothetical protein D5S18_10940 [Nocardia panacis]
MTKQRDVPRPLKRAEYALVFISSEAQKGWIDCVAAARNAMVDAWETLTRAPEQRTPRMYPLEGKLRYGTYAGQTYVRYQYKFTDSGRLWYFVEHAPKGSKTAGRVLLERCQPGHPKETE